MAETRNFTVSSGAWTRIASGRPNGEILKVQGSGLFVFVMTVGDRQTLPEVPVGIGHRVAGSTDIPLVARQHLWACATAPTTITVT